LPRYYRACQILCQHLGHDLEELVGKDRAQAAEKIVGSVASSGEIDRGGPPGSGKGRAPCERAERQGKGRAADNRTRQDALQSTLATHPISRYPFSAPRRG
jgi:hypothetical protein